MPLTNNLEENRSSTSTTMPHKKRIVMDEDQRRAFNEKVRDFVGAKYSQRPKVDVAYVEPTLFNVAHSIVSTSKGNTLYLGPKSAASLRAFEALRKAGIVAICNITTCVPCYHRSNNIKYCEVAINDESGADIMTYLNGATTFLHAILQNNGSVLVHCEQGISRSASIVIAYLMRFHNMTRDEAYVLCKSKRPIINPNEGFWKQLEHYEKALLTTTQQESKNDDNAGAVDHSTAVPCTTTEPFDGTWALRSSALYSTCREIMANDTAIAKELSCDRLATLRTREQVNQVLVVSLDFVWGRGILDVDLDWFVNVVCRHISQEQSPFEQVNKMLIDPESEFSQIWSGEIYQEHIDKVLKAFNR